MIDSIALKTIDEISDKLCDMSRKIWEHPEKPYKEMYASSLCIEMLKAEGFEVETGYAGLPSSIRATFGSGHPMIGFLGEFDSLPGQSQKDVNYKSPIVEGEYGHGCGHNLISVALIGAVIGAKREMQAKGIKGTLVFYACPAEEVLTGKGYMARAGAFKELDAALAWHPGCYNRSSYSVCTGVNSTIYHFKGVTAHAACDPEKGRSALDAVELMNVGMNYLREHVPMDVRIHYVITDGGTAPNIVPDKAAVWYYDRALKRETMEAVEERMLKVAKGAAMMTDTELQVEELGGCYPTLPNHVLGKLIDTCMRDIPQVPWTQEEIDYVKKINATNPDYVQECIDKYGDFDKAPQLHTGVMDIDTADDYGSTDVGDVGHITPTCFYKTACYGIVAPGHSWQVTSCVCNSIGQKGMIYGSKVTALAAIRLLTEPELLKAAKAEFDESMHGKTYKCMMPDELKAPID